MSVFEFIDNIFQILVTFGVFLTACVLAIKNPKFLLFQYIAGASVCGFVGTIYWTIYYIIYNDFVYYFSASELCYMTLYIFLIGVCIIISKNYDKSKLSFKQNLFTIFFMIFVVAINTNSYLMYGGLFWNLYYAIPLTILAYKSSKNLFIVKNKMFYNLNLSIIAFVIFNNIMFLVSCYGLNNLYVIFDLFFTSTFIAMLYFAKRGMDYDLC